MMKKQILYAATMLLFVGCASDDSAGSSETDARHSVYGYMPSYEFGDQEDGHATRVTLTAGDNGLSFAWDASDEICVVGEINNNPQSTTHCAMPSTSSGSLQTGFDGGAFTLNPSAVYYSYYPYNSNTDNTSSRQITLRSQTQTGNNSTAHLGKKNYMVAPKVTTDATASCLFHFTNVLSPCRFTLTLPTSAIGKNVNELTVTRYADNDLYFPTKITENFSGLNSESGENIQATGMTYNEGSDASFKQCKQSLDFTGCTIDGDYTLVAWMMLFPKDHSSGRYHVTVSCTDGTVYAGNVAGKNLVGGKAYRFSATLAEHIEMCPGPFATKEPHCPTTRHQKWHTLTSRTYLQRQRRKHSLINVTSSPARATTHQVRSLAAFISAPRAETIPIPPATSSSCRLRQTNQEGITG